MTGTIALILAGGIGSRLNVLVSDRAKPVVPFGGSCCIIDFTLQNTIKSGIKNIGIIAQYQSPSVQNHIEHTRVLELVNNSCDLEIFHPIDDRSQISMYHGTADAVAKNIDYIKQFNAREVLVLAGDHVYNMDYRPMIEFHREKRADLTIAMTRVPWKDISNYGIAITDGEQKISFWQEKPNHATSNLVSCQVKYVGYIC